MEKISGDIPVMRVINIIEEARWGGPQKRILLISKELKKYFPVETVIFLPYSKDKHFLTLLQEQKLSYRELCLTSISRSVFGVIWYILNFVPDVYRLYRAIGRDKFDIVHASGGAWQLKGIVAAKMRKLPIIWHLNDTRVPFIYLISFKFLKSLADSFILSADRVSKYYFPLKPNRKTYVVPPPVDTEIMFKDNFLAHKEMELFEGVRIVSVCNINPNKGLEILIEAVKILTEKGLIFKVYIAGPIYKSQINYSKFLLKKIKQYDLLERIHFMGPQYNVGNILTAADIFVCTSYSETGPMSLWEALAMSCAVISTDVGDVKNHICHGQDGYIIPPGNVEQLSIFLEKLICNPLLRKKFSNASRAIALNLDVRRSAIKTYKAYKDTLKDFNRNVQR